MAVHVKSIKMTSNPGGNDSGTTGPRHIATYECELDQSVPSFFALRHCQGFIAGTTFESGLTMRVPKRGARFLFDRNGVPVNDIGQTEAAFIAANPLGYADFGAFALDFAYHQIDRCSHRFTVTHREYQSNKFESAAFLSFFDDFSLSKIPALPPGNNTVAAITTGIAGVPSFTSVRWVQKEFETREAFVQNTFDSNFSVSPVTLMNPNQDVYPPRILLKRVMVVRKVYPTRNVDNAIAMETRYRNTLNSDPFTFRGQAVPKHHAKFLSVQSSDPITNNGTTYRMTSFEVEIAESPHYQIIPATGDYGFQTVGISGFEKITDKDGDGFQIGRQYPLKVDGFIAANEAEQHVDVIKDERDEIYTGLL